MTPLNLLLALTLLPMIAGLVGGALFMVRHERARRAAKAWVFPPRRVIETTLDDQIPF